MAVVKLLKKAELDKLLATLTLRLGRKIAQQDLIDACINLGENHIEELIARFSDGFRISPKRKNEILNSGEYFDFETKGSIDQDLYG
jgi:hypothetical protein